METTKKVCLIVLVAAFFGGCAFTPQQAEVRPDLLVAESDEGKGTPINLRVVDERDNQIIGRRGTGAMQGAEITTTQPLDAVFHDAISENLQKKGFVVVSGGQDAHSLRVDIRSFEYDVSMGFWSGGIHTNAALKATATRGSTQYDNMYRFEGEKRVQFVPGADKNEALINEMAKGVLTEMFNDRALIEFLAQ